MTDKRIVRAVLLQATWSGDIGGLTQWVAL